VESIGRLWGERRGLECAEWMVACVEIDSEFAGIDLSDYQLRDVNVEIAGSITRRIWCVEAWAWPTC
jgi:hypothetical protein